MTRCMIKKDFFNEGKYRIDIRNEVDMKRGDHEAEGLGDPLIEFCLPFSELKQLVDEMVDDGNKI